MKTLTAVSALCAASALVAGASAEFAPGNECGFSGAFFSPTGPYNSAWGGTHTLGGITVFYDTWGNDITVTSTVNDPWSVTFVMAFELYLYNPDGFTQFSILGLKSDGSILGVEAAQPGFFSTAGNNIGWWGQTDVLTSIGGSLTFTVYQVPAPGAIALLGCAGLVGSRRRRS